MQKQSKMVTIVKSLVVNRANEILLVRRNWPERLDVHGKWEFPGGKLEFNEQPEQTARREVLEESGYKVEVNKLLPKVFSFSKSSEELDHQLILICYKCTFVDGKMSLKDHGVSEIKWFKANEFPSKEECLPGTIDFLDLYLGGKK